MFGLAALSGIFLPLLLLSLLVVLAEPRIVRDWLAIGDIVGIDIGKRWMLAHGPLMPAAGSS